MKTTLKWYPMEITWLNDSIVDAIKATSSTEALEKAKKNWPDALVIELVTEPLGGDN
jgi:hypothetical protein